VAKKTVFSDRGRRDRCRRCEDVPRLYRTRRAGEQLGHVRRRRREVAFDKRAAASALSLAGPLLGLARAVCRPFAAGGRARRGHDCRARLHFAGPFSGAIGATFFRIISVALKAPDRRGRKRAAIRQPLTGGG